MIAKYGYPLNFDIALVGAVFMFAGYCFRRMIDSFKGSDALMDRITNDLVYTCAYSTKKTNFVDSDSRSVVCGDRFYRIYEFARVVKSGMCSCGNVGWRIRKLGAVFC